MSQRMSSSNSERGMMARIQRVGISLKLWQQMATVGYETPEGGFRCIEGLPEGAEYAGIDVGDDVIFLNFCHDSFPDVGPGGNHRPELRVVFCTPARPEDEPA